MKMTSKKFCMMVMMVFCVALLAITLIACNPSQKQKEQAVRDYGEAKAYNTVNGNIIHLSNGTISYYIPSSVSGDYRTISEYAISKANTLTSAVTVNTAPSSGSYNFAKTGTVSGHANANAVNNYRYNPSNGTVVGSTITYLTDHLDSKNLAYKKHTALHEMGHTFGLEHVEADIMRGWTVMISPHPNENKYQIDDYTEFDRYNITWKYGE